MDGIYPFLHPYKVTHELIAERGVKSIGRLRHLFFALPEFQIQEALKAFDPFPEELETLYREIGFGFMYRAKQGKFNTLFDPMTLIHTNKQVGYFATPEIADELACYDTGGQLLFFRTASNRHLAIDRNTVNGNNAVHFRGQVIDDSLYGFLKRFCSDRDYLEALDYEQEQKLREQAKAIEKGKAKQRDKIKNDYPQYYPLLLLCPIMPCVSSLRGAKLRSNPLQGYLFMDCFAPNGARNDVILVIG